MKLQVTETFDMTWEQYQDKISRTEYNNRLLNYIDQNLPGKPSWHRYRQIVSMGGSRSSKSYSILQLLMTELMGRENIKITVWRNHKVTCRATVMEDFQKIIMFDDVVYNNFKENKQSGTFTYMPTGSKIVFEGADSIGKVLGGTQDISFFNEVTEFNKDVYLQITQRTADRVFCDYNPSKDFWLEDYRSDEDTIFIHSTFMNNSFCPPNIVKQLLSYDPWETGSYEIVGSEVFYKGHKISVSNQPPPNIKNIKRGTANEFMWLVYGLGIGAEKPNRIYHSWTPISNEEYNAIDETEYFGEDFGTAKPTAIIGVKYNGNGAFYIKEHLYKPINDMESSLIIVMETKVPHIKKGISMIVGDSAKETYINILLRAGYFIIKATKGSGSVESGISIVQSFKIFYVQSPNLNQEYNNYSWQLDRYSKATEVPVKKDDHLMDAMRYIITYLYEWLNIRL